LLLEKLKIKLNYIEYKKINIKKAIINIINEINKKKHILIILNEFIDTIIFSQLRKLDILKEKYNINITNGQINKKIINKYEDFFLNNNMLNIPKNNTKLKRIFLEKLINYQLNINSQLLEFNSNTLLKIIEGSINFFIINKFIINSAYNKFIPIKNKKFIIDNNNQAIFLNSITKPTFISIKKTNTNISFGNNLIFNKELKEKVFTITNSYHPDLNAEILLPGIPPINDMNTYIDTFGKIKKTHMLIQNKNLKSVKNIIALLIYNSYRKYKKNIAKIKIDPRINVNAKRKKNYK